MYVFSILDEYLLLKHIYYFPGSLKSFLENVNSINVQNDCQILKFSRFCIGYQMSVYKFSIVICESYKP